jgi:hypothetical protein
MERVTEVSVRSAMVGRGSWLMILYSISSSCALALACASASSRSSFCTGLSNLEHARLTMEEGGICRIPASGHHTVIAWHWWPTHDSCTIFQPLETALRLTLADRDVCGIWTRVQYNLMCLRYLDEVSTQPHRLWCRRMQTRLVAVFFGKLLALLLLCSQVLRSLPSTKNPK